LSLAGGTEGLAGTRACPNRSVVGPSGEPEGVGPSGNAGEEVALGVATEVVGLDLEDASLVNVAGGDVSSVDKVAEPLGGVWVDFIVVGFHAAQPRKTTLS
jgi:hypothetical protein